MARRFVDDFGLSGMNKFAAAVGGLYAGIKAPEMYLGNIISKRQLSNGSLRIVVRRLDDGSIVLDWSELDVVPENE